MNRKIGVLMSYLAMIFEVLSTLLLTPFILRTLGQAEYGVYKLTAAIAAYLMLLDLGVGNSVIRYISKFRANKDEEQCRKFLGIATLYYCAIAIVTVVLGLILVAVFPTVFSQGLSLNEVKLGQKLLLITVINAAVMLGTAGFANTVIAYEYFAFQKGCLIAQIVLKMALTFLGLHLGYGSIAIVTVQLVTTVACRLLYVLFVLLRIKLLPMFHGLNVSFIKEVIVYSSFILLQMIATQVNACADQVLLGAFVTSSSIIIGVYGVGAQIVTYFQSIGNSMTGILMPGVVKLVERKATKEQMCDEMIRIGRLVFMVLGIIWVGFIVLGSQFIDLWAGHENHQAYFVSLILMTAHMFILTESIGTQILWAMNEHKEQAILKICIVLVNIILTIFLIKWNPLIGATIGTFISLFVGDVLIMNIIFVKKIGINIKHYYKGLFNHILPCMLISGLLGLVFKYMVSFNGWGGLFIKCCFILVIYIICMCVYGWNIYEKELIKSILYSVVKRIQVGGKGHKKAV